MKTIKIAGVPEHFNYPWQLAIENGTFEREGIDLRWKNIPEGTGKLNEMLRENATDLAVILTEGIVKDIINCNPSKIIQKYVESPLLWGIHVSAQSDYKQISDLQHKKEAISRMNSGSHLMSLVNAKNQKWNLEQLKFEIVNTIDGAVESLTKSESDYFMWEKFMTKPLVDGGIFRRLGEIPTPWPSFVIAASTNCIENNAHEIKIILKKINESTDLFKNISNIEQILAEKFNQKAEDIAQWLKSTNWSKDNFTKQEISNLQNQLIEYKIIDKKTTFTNLVEVL